MSTALVSKTPLRQVTTVRELLSNAQAGEQLAAVAASHMSPERMMRLLALAIDKTPAIAECTPLSILGCLMTCASLGLEPNTVLGHAYIVPFENRRKKIVEATLVVGYRGYLQLGHNSGQLAGFDAGIHYSDDEHWAYRKGAKAVLEHIPGPEKGEKKHAYAEVALVNGSLIRVVWDWEKVLAHRDRYSQGYKKAIQYNKTDNPWQTNEDVMAMKTMIRQLAKWMPMSSEIVRAAQVDGRQIDYAAFASMPKPTIDDIPPATGGEDDSASEIDAETGEIIESEPKQVEHKPAVVAEKVQTPAKEPVAASSAPAGDPMAAARAKAASAAAQRKQAPEQTEAPTAETTAAPAEEETAAAPANFAGLYQRIMDDVFAVDAADAFVALEVWETQLADWAERDPESHGMLMDAVAEREASGKKAGEL